MTDEQEPEDEAAIGGIGIGIRWPSAGNSLTPKTPDWSLNSCLAWAKQDWAGYILGYERAAGLLFRHVESTQTGMDTLVFPLMFLWRHAIELHLKRIIDRGQILLGRSVEYPRTHGLKQAWTQTKEVLSALQEHPSDEIRQVEAVIDELSMMDPSSDGFRYHETRNGSPSLSAAPSHLDLSNASRVLAGVCTFLDCAHSVLEQHIDCIAEYG